MNENLEKIERRTIQYFFNDGLTEIALGLFFLLFGAYFFGQTVLPKDSALAQVLDVSLVLIIVAAGFLLGRFIGFLKNRLTYPRTGYVAYKKKPASPSRKRIAAIIAAVIAVALSALTAAAPSFRLWLPALNGFLLGFVVFLFWRRTGVFRFLVLAGVSALVGIGVALAGVADIMGVSLYYALFGAAILISGLLAFAGYWRRSRTEPEPPDGR
jgi:MFS family permease